MIVLRSDSRSAKPRMVWRAAILCLTIQKIEPPISSSARFGRKRVTIGTMPSDEPRRLAPLQRLEAGAADRDLADVEAGHGFALSRKDL